VREFKADLIGDLSAGRARVTHFTSTSPSSLLLFGLTLIYWQGKNFRSCCTVDFDFLGEAKQVEKEARRTRSSFCDSFNFRLSEYKLATQFLLVVFLPYDMAQS
jgi:hypothetical protein